MWFKRPINMANLHKYTQTHIDSRTRMEFHQKTERVHHHTISTLNNSLSHLWKLVNLEQTRTHTHTHSRSVENVQNIYFMLGERWESGCREWRQDEWDGGRKYFVLWAIRRKELLRELLNAQQNYLRENIISPFRLFQPHRHRRQRLSTKLNSTPNWNKIFCCSKFKNNVLRPSFLPCSLSHCCRWALCSIIVVESILFPINQSPSLAIVRLWHSAHRRTSFHYDYDRDTHTHTREHKVEFYWRHLCHFISLN